MECQNAPSFEDSSNEKYIVKGHFLQVRCGQLQCGYCKKQFRPCRGNCFQIEVPKFNKGGGREFFDTYACVCCKSRCRSKKSQQLRREQNYIQPPIVPDYPISAFGISRTNYRKFCSTICQTEIR